MNAEEYQDAKNYEEIPDYDNRHYPTKGEIAERTRIGNELWESVKGGMR